ncbi:MAG: DUF4922 domain-containing protein [Planctomycetota bacterium]
MTNTQMTNNSLAAELSATWALQAREGFLLSDPEAANIETRYAIDERCGMRYRFRWMPHREIRGDVAELERRGILNPRRDESKLFRDQRDASGRHCFLCVHNIQECHPMERLVPLRLAGRDYLAGANFAWIERDHFTVMAAEHIDQVYSRHTLEAMYELHLRTGGHYRVLFNGTGAGATIPWHLHYQITTEPMPFEELDPDSVEHYPTRVRRCDSLDEAHSIADQWLGQDPRHNSINILVATVADKVVLFIFPRDQRRSQAANKGLVGGFEVAGDFVLSAPREEDSFRNSSAEMARSILAQIRPN